MSETVAVLGGAIWIAGRWIDGSELATRPGDAGVRATIDAAELLPGERIPRADRVTQLGALALGRAVRGISGLAGDGTAVLTASTVATAYTNERFERRRMSGKAAEPRSFPYTAPNAAAGEFGIALGARGPTLALTGGVEVALLAIERAIAWIARGACTRAVIVATECPAQTPRVATVDALEPVECAAAIVIGAGRAPPIVSVKWCARDAAAMGATALLSVGPLARVIAAARAGVAAEIVVYGGAGAAVEVRVT